MMSTVAVFGRLGRSGLGPRALRGHDPPVPGGARPEGQRDQGKIAPAPPHTVDRRGALCISRQEAPAEQLLLVLDGHDRDGPSQRE